MKWCVSNNYNYLFIYLFIIIIIIIIILIILLIINNYIINYYSKRMSSRCCPNINNCKAAGVIIEDRYPDIFWSRCLVHIMNLLMHDIIKMKDHDYKWIGALYKRGEKMIRFITNHSMAHFIFRNHSKLELLKIVIC